MKHLRWHLRHLSRSIGVPGWLGLVAGVAAVVLWLGSTVSLGDQADEMAVDNTRLERRLLLAAPAEAPTPSAREQLDGFTRRFPDEAAIAKSLARLHGAARKQGVELSQSECRYATAQGEPLARYTIVLPVRASYKSLRRFTREALRALPGLALEEASLRREHARSPLIDAQLRFVLFVVPGSADATRSP